MVSESGKRDLRWRLDKDPPLIVGTKNEVAARSSFGSFNRSHRKDTLADAREIESKLE